MRLQLPRPQVDPISTAADFSVRRNDEATTMRRMLGRARAIARDLVTRIEPNRLALTAGRLLPRKLSQRAVSLAVGRDNVALCLHRVGPPRQGEGLPAMNIHPRRLDALIAALDRACPGRVTVTFDDGYRDAVDYVARSAGAFRTVDWILFVCPEKSSRRIGFRWDANETLQRAGLCPEHPAPSDAWAHENDRPLLASAGRHPAFELASVEELSEVSQQRNVALGNHTNRHLPLAALTPEQAAEELATSRRDFERLFGPMRQFAFPYGTPGVSYRPEEADLALSTGATVWSTEARTYSPAEARELGVLPRFAVDGTESASSTLMWIAYRAALTRVRRMIRGSLTATGVPEPVDSRKEPTAAAG